MANRGRPTAYREEYAKQAFNLCLLGATNQDLARAFGVSDSSIDKWLAEKAEFSSAVKAGREEADAKVASRLFSRACGYEHQAVKIVADAKTGAEHIVPYTERYPPDTAAAIFWLKNRRPELWREKHEIAHTGEVTVKDERVEAVRSAVTELFGSAAGKPADDAGGGGKVVH